jgi:hypothetical protein
MAIDSVSSNNIDLTASYGVKSPRKPQEVQPPQRDVAPDNDGNGKNAQPTVNAHGQTVGTVIDTKA